MNFERIPPVTQAEMILDYAFKKARVKGKQKTLKGNWLQIIRKKESLKLDIVKDSVENNLQKITAAFPELSALPKFYLKLMNLTLDYQEFKRALGAVKWAIERNRSLHRSAVHQVNIEKLQNKIKLITNHYYGRLSSILKQISPQLKFLEACRQTMRSYPDIKEAFTVCLYGFPNVGKTTLLNKLTNTNAKVAAYAFTTKSINAGYLTINDQEIQVLDVPGTLARDKLNVIEMQAELVLKELADLIIYVYDVTESCGYTLEQQIKLKEKLTGEVIIYLSKDDLATKAEKSRVKDHVVSLDQIKQEIAARL